MPPSRPPRRPAAPAPTLGEGPPRIVRNATDGIDQLLSRTSASVTEMVQLAPGRLATRLFQFVAPGLHVDGGWTSHPVRAVGSTPPGRVSVTFVLACPGRCVMDACEVGEGDVLVWRPGETFHGISPAGYRWATVIAPEGGLDGATAHAASSERSDLPLRRAHAPADVRARVAALLDEMAAWGEPGHRLVEPATADGLRARWASLLRWALSANTPVPRPRRHELTAAAAVLAAEAHFVAHLPDTVYLADVSAATGVPARSLEHAFRSVLGMPPMRYLELLRAHALFRSLRGAGPDAPPTVADAFTDVGVGHGPRFAARYRSIFGETPAQTQRAARAARRTPQRG